MLDLSPARQEIAAALGGFAPDALIADGRLHRFPTSRRRGDEAGWYKVFDDGFPAVVAGDWRSGVKITVRIGNGQELTPAQREQFERIKREREAKQREVETEAARRARHRWDRARPAYPHHKYLAVKGIAAHGLRQDADKLLVPLYDGETLISLQQIGGDGDKRFTLDSRTQGGAFALGEVTETIWIGEGYATCATVFELTRLHTIVAFNSKNLVHVARKVRAAHPKANILILADDDYETSLKPGPCFGINPGIRDAGAAAEAVGGRTVVPPFNREGGDRGSDWNDFRRNVGNDETRRLLKAEETGRAIDDEPAAAPIVVKANGHNLASAETSSTPLYPAADGFVGSVGVHRGLTANSSEPWPKPKPIVSTLPPVPPLAPDLLPEALRGYVFDVAERMQAPPDFVAVVALCGLAAVIGNMVRIRPKSADPWEVVVNLWGAIIGRPSAMKSPALRAALAFLFALQDEMRKAWEASQREADLDDTLATLDAKNAAKRAAQMLKAGDREAAKAALSQHVGQEDEEDPCPRIIVNDATVEKLGELLNENSRGLLLIRDELPGFLARMEADEYQSERAFYLEAFNGDGAFTYDRIGRGTIHIEHCTLSIIGGVQPSRIAPLVRGAMTGVSDDGLIQRLQMAVWPDDMLSWRWVDRSPDMEARDAYERTFRELHAFSSGLTEPMVFAFSPGAQELFRAWVTEVQTEARAGKLPSIMESHLLKMPKTVASLALIFELVAGGRDGVVREEAAARALDWADYLKAHAARLYAVGAVSAETGARLIIERRGQLEEPFKARDIQRKGWAGLTDRDAVADALELLITAGHIRGATAASNDAGGRPSTAYTWNPQTKAEG